MNTDSGRRLAIWAFCAAIVGGLSGCIAGVVIARVSPVFGTFAGLSKPGSKYREDQIPIHVFAFGLTGLTLGAASGAGVSLFLPESRPRRSLVESERLETRPPIVEEDSPVELDMLLRRRVRARRKAAALRFWIAAACITALVLATIVAIAIIVARLS